MARKKAEPIPSEPIDPNAVVDIDALIAQAKTKKIQVVFVASPRALGATYDEVVRNLDKIADAEIPLMIVPTRHRAVLPAG